MDETTLQTLEYPSVLAELASFAKAPVGAEKALSLRPRADIVSIEDAYAEYREAEDIVKVSGAMPLGGVSDLREVLSRTEPEGSYLLPEDLLVVGSTLLAAALVRSLATQQFVRLYPRVGSRIGRISGQEALRAELERILDDKGAIRDTASPELYRIRREIRSNKERARGILESITTDARTREYLQEDIITIRDDRYVLAIKAGVHAAFEGVVHGRSGSGATFFIEPIALVELNNKVAILKKQEKAEEIEILKAATRSVAAQRQALLADQEELASIDLVQAKALFGRAIGARVPEVGRDGEVRLLEARHPLLAFKEMRGQAVAVPVELYLPAERRVLVISGANTGGKTVALKTLGLLTLMALCALPLPAGEGSKVVVFRQILSDIGDRQDIIASLSTFSAHVKRMREFLDRASPGTLVLIDEAGAGTDPSEGGAFALASIDSLRDKGAKVVVTTHLNLLKAHAQTDEGSLNACVEFDEGTLRPLYRLRYGMPGPSLGLSIAQSLGIPAEVVDRARGYIKEKEGAFIESVRALEEEKEEVGRMRQRLAALEAGRSQALSRLRKDREAIVERAKKRVEALVSEADAEIRASVERFRHDGAHASSRKAFSGVERAASKFKASVGQRQERYVPAAGDRVSIEGSNTRGVVLAIDEQDGKAEVMVGSLKVWAPWGRLKPRGGDKGRVSQGISVNADMEVATELNIIGLRVDEAMARVIRFLDNAHAGGAGRVEIIHGIGTGALARAVEEHLKASPHVRGFQSGGLARGGGATVVDLR